MIHNYCRAYPRILQRVKKRKNLHLAAVPFRETNRYYRGRIIDCLRAKGKIREGGLSATFLELPPARFQEILSGLVNDGLIIRKKDSILLP